MKKIIRLTESDLTRLVKRVISEASNTQQANALKSQVDAISNKKVPGARSMQYCAGVTLSDKTLAQAIKNSCTSEAWGGSCSWYMGAIPINEFGTFSKCVTLCIRDAYYRGKKCV